MDKQSISVFTAIQENEMDKTKIALANILNTGGYPDKGVDIYGFPVSGSGEDFHQLLQTVTTSFPYNLLGFWLGWIRTNIVIFLLTVFIITTIACMSKRWIICQTGESVLNKVGQMIVPSHIA